MGKLKLLLASRKFWAGIVGLVFVFLAEFVPDFPLDADQVTNVVMVVVAYIIGTGIEDSGFASK